MKCEYKGCEKEKYSTHPNCRYCEDHREALVRHYKRRWFDNNPGYGKNWQRKFKEENGGVSHGKMYGY